MHMIDSLRETDAALAELQATDHSIVLDGAVDLDRYVKATPRILWILREPNGGGPWDLRQFFRETLFTYDRWQMTSALLIRVSHGLLRGCMPWGDWADDARAIADSLRDVAVININKRGGDSAVNWERLYRASLDFSPFISRQMEALAPDITILAGTYEVLPNQFRQRLATFDESEDKAIKLNNTIFVRAYHTNQRRITHETYYERIRQDILRLQTTINGQTAASLANQALHLTGPA